MPFLHWRSQHDTGLGSIDAQHREIFEALRALAAALGAGRPADRAEGALARLSRLLIRHCQTEEALMKEMAFPERLAHAREHQEVILRVRDLQYQCTKGRFLGPEAAESLGAWLDRHIRQSDRAYARRGA